MFRVGQGFDVHKLVKNQSLVIGGVKIPFEKGLEGHSDADVLTHAIMDALLGTLAAGDIGQWFPDTDKKYKNADSLSLLSKIVGDRVFKGWKLGNIDATVICEKPKIAKFIPQMRKNYIKIFKCEKNQVSIKATTTEELGFCGRGEGIAAMATLLVYR